MTDREHELMDEKPAAEYMATTPRHLRRLREQGLPCVRIGAKVRYLRADLDRFIDAARQTKSA